MSHILKINSSVFSENGQSSRLADTMVNRFIATDPETSVVEHDLSHDPIPHLDAMRFQSFLSDPANRTQAQQDIVDLSDRLIDELNTADIIVIGLPMYNFGIPSQLKAYFDHIARAGITFRYTESGPKGLLTGKKAYVLATRGGTYEGTALDTQTQYVRDFLGFIGITDVEFIYAEGLAMGEEHKQAALTKAHSDIQALLSTTAMAA